MGYSFAGQNQQHDKLLVC